MGDMILVSNETLDDLFNRKLIKLKTCKEITKSYIISVLKKYITNKNYFNNQTIGIEYLQAQLNTDFAKFQNIGDWIFFIQSNYPDFFEKSSTSYYTSLGQSSYYKCYKILNKQWVLFEELADNFKEYSKNIHEVKLNIEVINKTDQV